MVDPRSGVSNPVPTSSKPLLHSASVDTGLSGENHHNQSTNNQMETEGTESSREKEGNVDDRTDIADRILQIKIKKVLYRSKLGVFLDHHTPHNIKPEII